MKNPNQQYRQGDVLLQRVSSFPKKLKAVARERGRVILAHGEVTGHAHALDERGTSKFQSEDGSEYFKVKGRRFYFSLPVLRDWRGQVMVNHSTHGLIEFAKADVEIRDGMVVVDGAFGLLKHDEHNTQAIPEGLYKGGGATGTVHQREYSPEEIRRVAD